jgi:hypothetical protein
MGMLEQDEEGAEMTATLYFKFVFIGQFLDLSLSIFVFLAIPDPFFR